MKVDYLCNQPEYVNEISGWVYKEFVKKLKGHMSIEEVNKCFNETNIDTFPITFIAIKNGRCLGVVSIFENDLKTQNGLKPWLATLYVKTKSRNKGIAKILIDAVIEKTKEMGYSTLYLRTEHKSEYYKKRNWKFVYKPHDENGKETEVYKYEIK
jgi:GNAT superfamily N-acetyltransferase